MASHSVWLTLPAQLSYENNCGTSWNRSKKNSYHIVPSFEWFSFIVNFEMVLSVKLSKPSEAIWSHLLVNLPQGSWLAFGQSAMEFDVARAFKTSSSIVNVAFGIPLSLVTGKLWSCVHACTPKNRALTSINVHLICLSFAYLSILNWHPSTDSRLVLRMALRHWLSLQHLQAIAHWWMLAWHCFRRVRWRADATLKVKRHKWWNYTLGVSIPNDVFQRWNNIKIDQIYQVRLSTRVALTACSPQNHRRDPTSHSKSCTSRSAHCSAGHRQRLHAEYWAHQVSRCWVSLDHHLWNEDTIENRSRPSNGTNFLWNHWMKTVCNCLQSKLLFQTPVCNPMPNARYARQYEIQTFEICKCPSFLMAASTFLHAPSACTAVLTATPLSSMWFAALLVIIQQANFDMGSINVIIFEERPRCVQSHWARFG